MDQEPTNDEIRAELYPKGYSLLMELIDTPLDFTDYEAILDWFLKFSEPSAYMHPNQLDDVLNLFNQKWFAITNTDIDLTNRIMLKLKHGILLACV